MNAFVFFFETPRSRRRLVLIPRKLYGVAVPRNPRIDDKRRARLYEERDQNMGTWRSKHSPNTIFIIVILWDRWPPCGTFSHLAASGRSNKDEGGHQNIRDPHFIPPSWRFSHFSCPPMNCISQMHFDWRNTQKGRTCTADFLCCGCVSRLSHLQKPPKTTTVIIVWLLVPPNGTLEHQQHPNPSNIESKFTLYSE